MLIGSQIIHNCFTISQFWAKLLKISKNRIFWELRPKQVVLFPEFGLINIFLSPTRPHKLNVYENIYFLFQKTHIQNKKISTNKFIGTNLRFFLFKQ